MSFSLSTFKPENSSDTNYGVIMTLNSKLGTIIKFNVFRLYHMPRLISIGVQMIKLRGEE